MYKKKIHVERIKSTLIYKCLYDNIVTVWTMIILWWYDGYGGMMVCLLKASKFSLKDHIFVNDTRYKVFKYSFICKKYLLLPIIIGTIWHITLHGIVTNVTLLILTYSSLQMS